MKITDKRTPTHFKIKDVSPGQIIQITWDTSEKFFLVNRHNTPAFGVNGTTTVSNIQNGNQIDLYSDGNCIKVNAELVINS